VDRAQLLVPSTISFAFVIPTIAFALLRAMMRSWASLLRHDQREVSVG
jgi:hypothetical protein